MYCPKCKEIFEEGSRRFCPTDGARLVHEADRSQPKDGGIFANLIQQMGPISDIPEPMSGTGGRTQSATMENSKTEEPQDEIFFELDESLPQPRIEILRPVEESKATVRKVSVAEIPAGHVEVGTADAHDALSTGFEVEDPHDFIGQIVKGRYSIVDYLGGDKGSLAYLADDKILADRKVLVRILTRDTDDEVLDGILSEERIALSHFSHPNVARLIDSGEFKNGVVFLVSEFVDALSVDDILAIHGRFDPARAARVIRQAANALGEAHQQGILHRDIRSANLIIDVTAQEFEQTKLVNFGASKGDATPENLLYKAPEVLDGRISTIACDIFSLAVVAYEMLTGELPFAGATEREVLRSQQTGLQKAVTDIIPELSPAVDYVLEKAMSFRPGGRYARVRDFGEALFEALSEAPRSEKLIPEPLEQAEIVVDEEPAGPNTLNEAAATPGINSGDAAPLRVKMPKRVEPAWKSRSPEPPAEETSKVSKWILAAAVILLLAAAAGAWYFFKMRGAETVSTVPPVIESTPVPTLSPSPLATPPQPRNVQQPPNTNYYENSKANLKGDLLLNFVGFTLYYPKEWKVNGPQPGSGSSSRGKFLDISRNAPDGRLMEQMLVSYYPSRGTFDLDAERFPELVKETSDTLSKLLPNFELVSQHEVVINGDWRAYEIKFQGGGLSASGEKMMVWGRRVFVPASRQGVKNGFEITMLATSLAADVKSVDDVGVKGELGQILDSFEPSQNF